MSGKIAKQIMEFEEGAAVKAMSENSISPKPGGWIVERAEEISGCFRIRECIMKFGAEREGLMRYKQGGVWCLVGDG